MDVKAGTAFRYVRGELTKAEKEASDLRTQLAEKDAKITELSGKAMDDGEIAALRTRVAEQDKELAIVRFETTPEYQAVAKGLNTTEAQIAAIAGKNSVPSRDLAAALLETDPVKRGDLLGELTKDFKPYDLVSFDRLVVERDSKLEQKSSMLSQASDRLKSRQQAEQESARKANEQMSQSWTKALDVSTAALENEIPITKSTGDEKWDADVKAGIAKVKNLDINKVSNEDMALRLYKAEMLPLVLRLVTSLVSDNTALNERLTKVSGGTLSPGAGTPPAPTPVATKPKEDASFFATLKEKLPGIGLPA